MKALIEAVESHQAGFHNSNHSKETLSNQTVVMSNQLLPNKLEYIQFYTRLQFEE